MRELKKYLAVFVVPKTESEHQHIRAAIDHHSCGDFQMVFMQVGPKPDLQFTVSYLFTSDKPPHEMGFGLLNGDQHLVVEVGEWTFVDGSVRAQEWLRKHRKDPL